MKIKSAAHILLIGAIGGAGLLLTGCASCGSKKSACGHKEDRAEYCPPSVAAEPSGAQPESMAASDEVVIPLYQETMKVGKREVDAGSVTLHKTVSTETVSQPIELRKETLTIEREPAGAQSASSQGNPFEEKSITINLQKEEPVVEKDVVVSENIRAKKSSTIEQSTVQRDLKRENIQFDKNGSDITIIDNGNVNESAGAESKKKDQEKSQQNP